MFDASLRFLRSAASRQTARGRTGVFIVPLIFSLLLGGCALKQQHPDELRLTILHTNDTHANWGGHTKDGRICYAALCDGGSGGAVRMDRAARAVRSAEPATLLLGAGDQFQGTLFYTRYKDVIAAEMVNTLGYDAFTPGNHEFDDGCPAFKTFVRALKMPVLAANLSLGDNSRLPLAPWVITKRQGRRIGIVGLANPDTPNLSSPCREATFAAVEPDLRKAVDELRAKDVNIIILITHLGLEADRELARTIAGVDVIVGGHTHSLLSNVDKNALGPYPVVETSPNGEPVLVVTNGYALKNLGRLDVTFDGVGVAKNWKGEPIRLNDAALAELKAPPAKPALTKILDTRSAALRSMMEEAIGKITAKDIADGNPLEKPSVLQCRAEECRSGNLVTDAMRQFWNGKADIALMGGGTLRNSLPAGKVSVGDIIATLPFENRLMLAQLDGKTILAALEQGLSRYEEGKGFFLQVSGLRYTFNPQKPRGSRLIAASVQSKDGTWKKLSPKALYWVTTSSFQAEGGDGYSMFVGRDWKDSERNLSDILREYLIQHNPAPVALEGRITNQAQK